MNSNIIKFYMITNRLKEKIRTGWQEIDVSAERLESVAEHVYGCAMLAIAIDSEYELNIDMYKVLKMLCLHELEETIMQVKIYDLNGQVRMEKMMEDLYFHGEEGLAIKDKINTPSDVWIECDKKLYKDDPIFNSLIEDIQKMKIMIK